MIPRKNGTEVMKCLFWLGSHGSSAAYLTLAAPFASFGAHGDAENHWLQMGLGGTESMLEKSVVAMAAGGPKQKLQIR